MSRKLAKAMIEVLLVATGIALTDNFAHKPLNGDSVFARAAAIVALYTSTKEK